MFESWRLDDEQRVVYLHGRYMYFQQQKYGSNYIIFLSFNQVDILHQIIRRFSLQRDGDESLYFPLGNGVNFMFKNSHACIQFFTKGTRRYIRFHPEAWDTYMNYVHPKVITLLNHERRSKDCECTLANERNHSFGYPKGVSRSTNRTTEQHERRRRRRHQNHEGSEKKAKRRVLFREAAYDALEDKKNRQDGSLFQQRYHTGDWEDNTDRSGEDTDVSSMDTENEDGSKENQLE